MLLFSDKIAIVDIIQRDVGGRSSPQEFSFDIQYHLIVVNHLLTSTNTNREASIRKFTRRLCDRGYTPYILRPLFHDALRRAQSSRCEPSDDQEKSIFLHLEYHPYDPSSRDLQRLFREILQSPASEPILSSLCNRDGVPNGINRMIVAFRRPPNLKNILCRKIGGSICLLRLLRTYGVWMKGRYTLLRRTGPCQEQADTL
jgi:hypothetical protein